MALAEKCVINIDNQRVYSFIDFTIKQRVGKPDRFDLLCGRNALVPEKELETKSISSLYSKAGKEITFQIENIHTGNGNKNFFFKGIIIEVGSSRNSGSIDEVLISGYSPEILLQGDYTRRSFENRTLKQIAEEILLPYPQDVLPLSSTSPRNSSEFPYIVQYDETNYDFLTRLAGTFSEWLYFDGNKLVFGTPKNTTIELIHSVNLSLLSDFSYIKPKVTKFHSKFRDYSQDMDVNADSQNISIDQYLSNQSRSLYSTSENHFRDSGFYNYYNSYSLQPDPINDVFKLHKLRSAFNFHLITGNTSEPLSIGNGVQVYARNKQGRKDDNLGEFQVYSSNHHISSDLNYSNSFEAGPKLLEIGPIKTDFQISTFPESAIVTDNNDPEHLGRIRVRTRWHGQDHMTPWTRIVTQHSGAGRGYYFVPEVGDEVLIDYEHGDPQKPIVIGTLFSKNHGPDPSWITNKNDIKKIRTRSGHTIEFDDTSGSEKLLIYNGSGSSASSNSNKILFTLNPEKITIESKGDIELKGNNIKLDAQGSIDLHGSKGLTIKTESGDTSVEGVNVSLKAQAEFKALGAAGTEVSSYAITKIQGPLVQIN